MQCVSAPRPSINLGMQGLVAGRATRQEMQMLFRYAAPNAKVVKEPFQPVRRACSPQNLEDFFVGPRGFPGDFLRESCADSSNRSTLSTLPEDAPVVGGGNPKI